MLAGLPVHVNGYFELSSNRRSIWFSDLPSDLVGQGKVRSDWNLALLEDLAAPLYARLLEESAKRCGPTDSYYSLWPPQNLAPPWSNLAAQLYKEAGPSTQNPAITAILMSHCIERAYSPFPLCLSDTGKNW